MIESLMTQLGEVSFGQYFAFACYLAFVALLWHGMHELDKDDNEKTTKKPKKHKKV